MEEVAVEKFELFRYSGEVKFRWWVDGQKTVTRKVEING